MGVDFHGLFFNPSLGDAEPNMALPTDGFVTHSKDHPDKFQNYLSTYLLNSLFNSYFLNHDVKLWIRSGMVDNAITCATLEVILPGISKAYGASTPVDIKLVIKNLADFQVSAETSVIKSVSELTMSFHVQQDGNLIKAVELDLEDVKFGFTALTNNMAISLGIQ
jgi:hypothetical protein